MKTITPPKTPSQLELALDYKQAAIIRQLAKSAIEEYLKKEAQMLTFDGFVDLIDFIYQLNPRIQIIAHGEFEVTFSKVISNPKQIRIIYKGKEIEV